MPDRDDLYKGYLLLLQLSSCQLKLTGQKAKQYLAFLWMFNSFMMTVYSGFSEMELRRACIWNHLTCIQY